MFFKSDIQTDAIRFSLHRFLLRKLERFPRSPKMCIQDLFDMLDVDGKGHLSLVEFADGLLNLLTPHGSEMVQIHSPHLPIYISLPLSHSLSLSLSLSL